MDDSPWMPPSALGAPPAPRLPEPVLPAPAPSNPLPPAPLLPPWAPGGSMADPPPPVADGSLVDPVDVGEQPRRRRSKVLVGGAVAAVVAVGAAGVFAVSSFSEDSQGGAADPTELGTALLTAIENEDVLGMVDVLSPGERDLFRQPLIDLVSELTRLEVLSPEADLAKISGLDIALENESVAARATNVPDIVNVDLAADATTTVDGETVPVGALITDNMDPDDVTEMRGSEETSTEQFEFSLTAVEQDGRWYFSLFHTAAESLRAELDPRPEIPLEGVGSQGADSPEGAVDQMLDSVESLDLTAMVRALNPGEAAALQRYAPLFLDDAQAELDQAPIELEITNRELRVDGDGDQRTVLLDALTIAGTVDDGSEQPVEFEVGFSGECTNAVVAGETYDFCAGDAIPGVDDALGDAPAVGAFVDALGRALADIEPIGVEVRSFDGQWYVSPTATSSEAFLAVLRALDRQEIDELIELGNAAADEFFGLAFGGFGADSDSDTFEDLSLDDSLFDDDVSFDESMFDESMFDDLSFDESMFDDSGSVDVSSDSSALPWEDCYEEFGASDAAACFQRYVDTGDITATFVPAVLRFPECGLAEVSWQSELYSMSDADFIATLEAARPCFQALVDSGQIQQIEVPAEVSQLECYEGRNWYNVFDDPAYDERYYACIEALNAA